MYLGEVRGFCSSTSPFSLEVTLRALLIGDPHCADHPPSSRITYRDDILNKLRWCVNHANEIGVDAVVSMGDTIHVKQPNRTSHGLIRELGEIFEESKAPVVLGIGNHDMLGNRLDSLPNQPVSTLAMHPNIEILIGGHEELPMFFMPYVNHTPENLKEWTERYHDAGGPEKYPLLLTHLSLYPESQAPIFEYVSYENFVAEFKAPHIAYGHIHSRVKGGPFIKVGDSWVANNGAISRGSLTEETINRELAVTLYDSSNKDEPFVSIPIPYRPASEVFKLEEVAVEKDKKVRVEAFLNSLKSSELNYLTVEDILDEAKKRPEFTHETVDELEDIITSVTMD